MGEAELTYLQYVHQVEDRAMLCTSNTMCREGIMVPAGGYQPADATALTFNWKNPATDMTHLEEINNFSVSGIGELASVVYPSESSNIRCFIYGYANYLAVPYSCLECRGSAVRCDHDNLVGVLLKEAREIQNLDNPEHFYVALGQKEVRPKEVKMAYFGSAYTSAKIILGPTGHLYQDRFIRKELFVKKDEIKNLSVSPTLQRSLIEDGIQGLSKDPKDMEGGAESHRDISGNNKIVEGPCEDLAEQERLVHAPCHCLIRM
jgi:hypothetical protein